MKPNRVSTFAALGLAAMIAAPGPARANASFCNGDVVLEATMPGRTGDSGTDVIVRIRNASGRRQDVQIALGGTRPGFRLTVSGVLMFPGYVFSGVIARQNTSFNPFPGTADLASVLRVTCDAG